MIDYDTIVLATKENHTVTLPILSPRLGARYIIKNVEGLDAPDFNLITRESLYGQTTLLSNRVAKREITLTVMLNVFQGRRSVSDGREDFYKLVGYGPEDYIFFRLTKSGTKVIEIPCYVKSIEQNPFTKDPELQVVFSCREEYLTGRFAGVIPRISNNGFEINYTGTAPTYVHIAGQYTGTSWAIRSMTSEERVSVERAPNALRFNYDSRPEHRDISSGSQNMIGNLVDTDRYNYWIMLRPGKNLFRVTNVTQIQIFEYYDKFLGV